MFTRLLTFCKPCLGHHAIDPIYMFSVMLVIPHMVGQPIITRTGDLISGTRTADCRRLLDEVPGTLMENIPMYYSKTLELLRAGC
jgi:hypothetical protein